MSKGIGGHTLPNEGISKIWLTPPELIKSLGPFDLDPCAAPSPRPWPTASKHIELPENGLSADWFDRVWLNPPYTQEMWPWLDKMRRHGSGIALIFARTETETWQKWVWPYADSIFFIEGRLFFHFPDGRRGTSNAGGPSALISYSERDTDFIINSGLSGYLVQNQVRLPLEF